MAQKLSCLQGVGSVALLVVATMWRDGTFEVPSMDARRDAGV
jgi:hypothetical protein